MTIQIEEDTCGKLFTAGLIVTILLLGAFALTAGCIEDSTKKMALDAISPVVVLKGSEQYCKEFPQECNATVNVTTVPTTAPTPTPVPTITVEPESTFKPTNNTEGGMRYEGQWFDWTWYNASGLQTLNRGIIVYGHSYHDVLTYWDYAWNNYFKIYPHAGKRFLAVYVHEEDFGPDDTGLWGYNIEYFHLGYAGQEIANYTGYNKVYPFEELDFRKPNYYNIEYIKPFGITRQYRKASESARATGGYIIEIPYDIRTGRGNAWDGYILYEIPKTATDKDLVVYGYFAGKNVQWQLGQKFLTGTLVPTPSAQSQLSPSQPVATPRTTIDMSKIPVV